MSKRGISFVTGAVAAMLVSGLSAAAQDHAGHDMSGGHEMGHGGQRFYMYDGPAVPSSDYRREVADYGAPAVVLRDRHGAEVHFADLLAEPGPLAMQFIFTSCATICPVLSAGFAQAGEDMTGLAPGTRLISISIDPEYDTPERLDAYARRYRAPDSWLFLTGSLDDIRRVIAAFDALYFNNNKAWHRPYTYMRAAPGAPWLRLEGLLGRADLVGEYGRLLASAPLGESGE